MKNQIYSKKSPNYLIIIDEAIMIIDIICKEQIKFREISAIFRLSVEVDTISSTDSRFDEFSGNFR